MTVDDTDISELGYPTDELNSLVDAAQSQFREQVNEHGPGKNWMQDEARWHIWKACDELFQARDHADGGNYEQARYHFADALNHQLMAMEITHRHAE